MAAPISSDMSVLPEVLGGRFRVLGALGRGAIAEVVRARDEQTGAEVALKILYPHLRESAVVVERFRREVEIVRRIAHPNVLRIHDVVEGDGRLFLVMDFHPGGDLADRLARRGRLHPGEVVHLAQQLCGALAAAHRAGVVHRDVKPSNVLVGDGSQIDLRLCDFGLARTVEGAGLTVANAVLGTPEYMAPEAVTEGQADPRSDIYSLGVVLFEAATGRLPFYGDSPYQLMRQHVDVEAPRAQSLVADLPPALDVVIARALAKDPLDRFATADDLARALTEDPRALAPVHPRVPGDKKRTCFTCGGWLVERAATCADCGARSLRLQWQRGGVDVLVEGPGKVAEKLDAWKHASLFRLLDQIAPQASPTGNRRPAPRLPFYVARGLTEGSAEELVELLKVCQLDAQVVRPSPFGPKSIRKKASAMAARYGALAGGTVWFNGGFNALDFLPHAARLAIILGPTGVFLGMFVSGLIRGTRPLLRSKKAPSLSGPADDLALLLSNLQSRQDRRLVARVLDRLTEIEALGLGDLIEPLGRRALLAAKGLEAFDERRASAPPGADHAGRALDELRRDELGRMVFRSDLLRTASRLESANLILARAAAGRAAQRSAALDDEIRELASEVETEEDLQAWLGELR